MAAIRFSLLGRGVAIEISLRPLARLLAKQQMVRWHRRSLHRPSVCVCVRVCVCVCDGVRDGGR